MRISTQLFHPLLLSLLISGCGGPYVMERLNIENGMVVGEEEVVVESDGQVTGVSQDGYVPDNRYLDSYKYGDDNLGPNAPGYIP